MLPPGWYMWGDGASIGTGPHGVSMCSTTNSDSVYAVCMLVRWRDYLVALGNGMELVPPPVNYINLVYCDW